METSVRRLKPGTIRKRATLLLVDYALSSKRKLEPPIPVEEILGFLKLTLDFDDLRSKFGVEGALGVTVAETRQIFIDESLDPVEHPETEGRYNFTIAHEIGHWRLHPHTPDIHLPSSPANPRLAASHREIEWQADKFAAYLLMPERLVCREWESVVGHPGPVVVTPQMEAAGTENFGSRAAFVRAFNEDHARDLAERFKVSVEAMRIRLTELGSLPRE